jgi:hypothetical protein
MPEFIFEESKIQKQSKTEPIRKTIIIINIRQQQKNKCNKEMSDTGSCPANVKDCSASLHFVVC